MIGVDWGTSSLRAFRIAADGSVLDRREATRGILSVPAGGFPAVLEEFTGTWLDAGERQVLLSGMVGSRQGWIEVPYSPCPAGVAELCGALVHAPFQRSGTAVEVLIVPGVSDQDANGIPDVMRGEEVQLIGALPAEASFLACLPGSHSKWVNLAHGRITGFATHLTGEAFAALRGHTILGRMMQDGPPDPAAFADGVRRATQQGGLLHHLFGVRTLGLFGQLPDLSAASYLSGLLIGHECLAAIPEIGREGPIHLIGAASLCALYASALASLGHDSKTHDQDAAARGLWQIGRRAQWT